MSDMNEGSSFGDGNFAEFISRERDRLRAEREQVFNGTVAKLGVKRPLPLASVGR